MRGSRNAVVATEPSLLLPQSCIPLAPQCRPLTLNHSARTPCPAAVRDSLWAAAILYVVRLAGVWLGCWLGAGAGGTPPDVGQRLWMGMITQVHLEVGTECADVALRCAARAAAACCLRCLRLSAFPPAEGAATVQDVSSRPAVQLTLVVVVPAGGHCAGAGPVCGGALPHLGPRLCGPVGWSRHDEPADRPTALQGEGQESNFRALLLRWGRSGAGSGRGIMRQRSCVQGGAA